LVDLPNRLENRDESGRTRCEGPRPAGGALRGVLQPHHRAELGKRGANGHRVICLGDRRQGRSKLGAKRRISEKPTGSIPLCHSKHVPELVFSGAPAKMGRVGKPCGHDGRRRVSRLLRGGDVGLARGMDQHGSLEPA